MVNLCSSPAADNPSVPSVRQSGLKINISECIHMAVSAHKPPKATYCAFFVFSWPILIEFCGAVIIAVRSTRGCPVFFTSLLLFFPPGSTEWWNREQKSRWENILMTVCADGTAAQNRSPKSSVD